MACLPFKKEKDTLALKIVLWHYVENGLEKGKGVRTESG